MLDVACGTGVLTREARRQVGPGGQVTGLDCNEGMLQVAARNSDGIDWRLGQAEALPFDDAAFDAAVSQFGLMFFGDRARALAEMWRVIRPGGRLAVAVWGPVEDTPGYAAMVRLLEDLFGAKTADALRAPYCLGDTGTLAALCRDAGIDGAEIETRDGAARFPSIEAWVHTDVKGWTLADMIDDDQYAALRAAAGDRLQRFVQADGSVRFAHPAHIVTAEKR